MDSITGNAVLDVREGDFQASLSSEEIMRKLVNREFGLSAEARGSQNEAWSRLMQRPEFIDISPIIQYDYRKDLRKANGGICIGTDARIIMDKMRAYRQRPEFSKIGFMFPAVIPDSTTALQGLSMFRLHRLLYAFFTCESIVPRGGDIVMNLGVANLSSEGTRTTFLVDGATVSEQIKGLMTFDLPAEHLDMRRIHLIAPVKPGKRKLKIKSESEKMTFAKSAAVIGARVALGVAFGAVGGIGGGVLGGVLGKPMEIGVQLEVMDPGKERQVLERRAQVFAGVSRSLDEIGAKGMRTKYGDMVSREDLWKNFQRFASVYRVVQMSEKNGSEPVELGKKMFSSFTELEYGVKDLPSSYVTDVVAH